MAEEKPLQINCVITRIATLAAGGWNVTFHLPENAGMEARELLGHENKTQFVMFLVRGDHGEAPKVEREGKPEWAKKPSRKKKEH